MGTHKGFRPTKNDASIARSFNAGIDLADFKTKFDATKRFGADNYTYLDFVNNIYMGKNKVLSFSDVITHSRSGNATMFDSDGVVKWAPHNYYGYSNEIFPNLDSADITANADYSTGTDYGNSVRYLADSGGGSNGNGALALPPGADLKLVFWVRRINGSFSGSYGIYDNANSSYLSGHGYETSWPSALVTGSWVKQEINFTTTSNFTTARLWVLQKTAYGSMDIEIAGIHVIRTDLGGMVDNPEAISAANSPTLVPTSGGTAAHTPRGNHYEYNGSSWVNKGLLLETDAATNFLPYSEDFTQWFIYGATYSGGVLTAGNNNAVVYENVTFSAAGNHVFWVDLKAGTGTIACIQVSGYGTNYTCFFDLSAGTVGTDAESVGSIFEVGDGIYRCVVTFYSMDIVPTIFVYVCDADGSTYVTPGKTLNIYRAQAEEGYYPSSYIPTSGATATRAGETLSVNAANVPWSTQEMTFIFEGQGSWDVVSDHRVFGYLSGSTRYLYTVVRGSSNPGQIRGYHLDEGLSATVVDTGDFKVSTNYRTPLTLGYRLTTADMQLFTNGLAHTSGTNNSGTLEDFSAYDFGLGGTTGSAGGYSFSGTISRFRGWDKDISSARLVEETFSPSLLFSSGETGAWYYINPSYLYQDSSGTIPATVNGLVGYVTDLSGNGYHATQSNDALKPTLRIDDNGKYYLEFVGGDELAMGTFAIPSTFWSIWGFDSQNDSRGLFLYSGTSVYQSVFDNGSASAFSSGFGTLSALSVNQIDITQTRDALHDALVGGPKVVTDSYTGGAVSRAYEFGGYGSNYELNGGRLYGAIWRDRMTDFERARAEEWMARQSGVTL